MKKWLSVLVIVSLVVSLAFAMNGCGKGKDTADASTADTTESATEMSAEASNDVKDDMRGFLEELQSERDEMDFTMTVPTINEKYREEYDAMTLPSAAPAAATTAKQTGDAATTAAVRRETTTQFQFTSPSRAATTQAAATKAAAGGSSTTKAAAKTTAPSTTETTVVDRLPNVGGSGGSANSGNSGNSVDNSTSSIQPAQTTEKGTFLQKFVLDKINSGSYTLNFEYSSKETEDMANVPMSFYKNSKEDKVAFKAHVGEAAAQKLGMPAALGKVVDIRIVGTDISSNPHIYFAWPGGYCEISDEDFTQSADMLKEYDLVQTIFSALLQPGIEYHGYQNHGSYVDETFVDPENKIKTVLYYDGQGIAKVELIDMNTNVVQTTYKTELKESVPSDAFKLSGKKYTEDEMMNLFGNLAS